MWDLPTKNHHTICRVPSTETKEFSVTIVIMESHIIPQMRGGARGFLRPRTEAAHAQHLGVFMDSSSAKIR